jgi:hypothetical protein
MKYENEIEKNPLDIYHAAYARLVDSYFKFGRTPAVTGYMRDEAINTFNKMPIELRVRADGLQKILDKVDSEFDLDIRK